MHPDLARAIERDRLIDITTTGRSSGVARRIEIRSHVVNGRIFITGTPGPRSWYANLVANPRFTYHLKQAVQTDLSAEARPIVDPEEKRAILSDILQQLGRSDELDARLAHGPLVEVAFTE